MVLLTETFHGAEYLAFNVKERLGLTGVRHLDIRFYYLGQKYTPATDAEPFRMEFAPEGGYMILDYLRMEAD